jgi:hypothetical protein
MPKILTLGLGTGATAALVGSAAVSVGHLRFREDRGRSPITRANLDDIPAPLAIPLPLWLNRLIFVVGILIAVTAVRLWTQRQRHSARYAAQPAAL